MIRLLRSLTMLAEERGRFRDVRLLLDVLLDSDALLDSACVRSTANNRLVELFQN